MPNKYDSRRYIEQRAKERKPLPDAATIKREMGWALIEAQREYELPLPHDPVAPKID